MRIEDEQGHTRGSEGHDAGKPDVVAHPSPKHDPEHPGYETQDVNVSGVSYFLAGLMGFIVVFFFLCFYIGKAINYGFVKEDGEPDKWHPYGNTHNKARQDLVSNVEEQKVLGAGVQQFPTPRLVDDDDNQETADLHAREDLLLNYYSSNNEGGGTTVRIPIDRAMQLIAQRGLGAAPEAAQPKTLMAGDKAPMIQAPLTNGFARTGFELDTIETRKQKNSYAAAEGKKE